MREKLYKAAQGRFTLSASDLPFTFSKGLLASSTLVRGCSFPALDLHPQHNLPHLPGKSNLCEIVQIYAQSNTIIKTTKTCQRPRELTPGYAAMGEMLYKAAQGKF